MVKKIEEGDLKGLPEECAHARRMHESVIAEIEDPAVDIETIREHTLPSIEALKKHNKKCASCRAWAREQKALRDRGTIQLYPKF